MASDRDPAVLSPEAVVLDAEDLREHGLAACVGPPPLVLEIGFGRAELLIDLARTSPEKRYLGIEVSRKRVHKAARRVARAGLSNVWLVRATAEYLLSRVLPPSCASECWICFPDPWPKKRHHKRRLVQGPFLEALARVMEPGARLHVATDHPGYAGWIDAELSASPRFENLVAPRPFSEEPPVRRETAYEAEWLACGRRIAYFEYRCR